MYIKSKLPCKTASENTWSPWVRLGLGSGLGLGLWALGYKQKVSTHIRFRRDAPFHFEKSLACDTATQFPTTRTNKHNDIPRQGDEVLRDGVDADLLSDCLLTEPHQTQPINQLRKTLGAATELISGTPRRLGALWSPWWKKESFSLHGGAAKVDGSSTFL